MTKEEILHLENRLHNAIKESNLQALDELLHKDLLFVAADGTVITKELDLETYRGGQLKIYELKPTVENLNIIGDLAVITLSMDLKGDYNSQAFEAKYRYIRFWKDCIEGIKVVGGSGIQIHS